MPPMKPRRLATPIIENTRINAPHLECSIGLPLSLPAKTIIRIDAISTQTPKPRSVVHPQPNMLS